VLTKVALGNNRETVSIAGVNSITTLGSTIVNEGGFLAQPSNIGKSTRNMFTAIPEIGVNLKLDVTCNLRATLGYNFLWVSNIVRSGSQVDLNVDPRQINNPGFIATQPARTVNDGTFYLQGLTAGVEGRW
jgi:hypothetical protein